MKHAAVVRVRRIDAKWMEHMKHAEVARVRRIGIGGQLKHAEITRVRSRARKDVQRAWVDVIAHTLCITVGACVLLSLSHSWRCSAKLSPPNQTRFVLNMCSMHCCFARPVCTACVHGLCAGFSRGGRAAPATA